MVAISIFDVIITTMDMAVLVTQKLPSSNQIPSPSSSEGVYYNIFRQSLHSSRHPEPADPQQTIQFTAGILAYHPALNPKATPPPVLLPMPSSATEDQQAGKPIPHKPSGVSSFSRTQLDLYHACQWDGVGYLNPFLACLFNYLGWGVGRQ